MLTAVFPMKSSSSGSGIKYFDDQLMDSEKQRRWVGFDPKVHQKLLDFHERKKPVALSDCEVKMSKYSSDLEVVVQNSSELQRSPNKFDFDVSLCLMKKY